MDIIPAKIPTGIAHLFFARTAKMKTAQAAAPHQLTCCDITYIPFQNGSLWEVVYLAMGATPSIKVNT